MLLWHVTHVKSLNDDHIIAHAQCLTVSDHGLTAAFITVCSRYTRKGEMFSQYFVLVVNSLEFINHKDITNGLRQK